MSTIKSSAENLTLNADGSGNDIILQSNGSTVATIDSNKNLILGATAKTAHASYNLIQGNNYTLTEDVTAGASKATTWCYNAYTDAGNAWTYMNSDEARQIQQYNGQVTIATAGAGSAEGDITFSNKLTIDNDGKVELGNVSTTGATCGFEWQGSATEGTTKISSTGTGAIEKFKFFNPNGQVGTIQTSGSSTAYNTSSDYRLKENVVPMTGSIDRLKELKPSKFNFIADADKTVDGFLAHEVSDCVPEAISGEKDAMQTEEYEVEPAVLDDDGEVVTEAVMGEREVIDAQGIDQSKLVPLLTSALQEAVAKIEELTTRIETLENA